ncbi:flippase [Poseidonibacter antarcticus]|uniref:flippase n=1 Tax=Poseidonibacter antarcticus TaxID=2478538 RepID=UPI000EF4F5E8|nr:flippase [Poseidonibacter antarcticus]
MIKKIKSKFKSEENKRLLSNFFSLLSLQGLNYILPLLTMPYLFKVLGAEKYGLVAFAVATIFFLDKFVEYGYNLSATREVALNHKNKEKLSEIYSTVISVKLILTLVSFMILSLLILTIEKFTNEWLLFYLTFLIVIGNAIFPIWFFQGIEEMKYISYFNISAKLFFTAGIFVFVKSSEDYIYQPLLNGLGFILVGLYSLYFIRKKYDIRFTVQPIINIKNSLTSSWNLFVSDFIPNLYNNFSTFLLGFVTTMDNVGYFALANQIVSVFNNVITIIRNVTFPYLNKDYSKFEKIAQLTIFAGLSMSLIIFLTSYWVVPFVFGEKAYESLVYIYILALSPFFISISYTFGSNKMVVLKYDKEYRKTIVKVSILGFLTSILLIPLYGAYGAALTIVITRFFLGTMIYKQSRKLK